MNAGPNHVTPTKIDDPRRFTPGGKITSSVGQAGCGFASGRPDSVRC